MNFRKPPVYWLKGLAGTDKITIAQTISERTFADRKFDTSFSCLRPDFEDGQPPLHLPSPFNLPAGTPTSDRYLFL